MSKYIFIISSNRVLERDHRRYGVKYLKKKKKVIILDLSSLINHRSTLIYKKFVNKDIIAISKYKDLINLLKNKKFSYAIDYMGHSVQEVFIKFILVYFNIKIIRYLPAIVPPLSYNHIDQNNKIFKTDQRSLIKKFYDIPNVVFSFIKRQIINAVNYYSINIVVLTSKNTDKHNFIINNIKKKIYSHVFDYNTYLELKKKNKKVKKSENYIVYIDEHLSSHPDYFIGKNKPVADKNFYLKINKFFIEIKKKYKINIKIALHPKNNHKINLFTDKKNCYIGKTAELIKESKHILIHSSAAVSFAVLYKKPMTFLTTGSLNNLRIGAKITKYSKVLKSQLINMDNYKKNFSIKRNFDKNAYADYLNQYIKHPKSTKENTWVHLLKNIY
jgi:hypothetical protein